MKMVRLVLVVLASASAAGCWALLLLSYALGSAGLGADFGRLPAKPGTPQRRMTIVQLELEHGASVASLTTGRLNHRLNPVSNMYTPLPPSHSFASADVEFDSGGVPYRWRIRSFTFSWWIPTIVCSIVPIWFLVARIRMRLSADHCSCGYCLTGNQSGICLECGSRTGGAS